MDKRAIVVVSAISALMNPSTVFAFAPTPSFSQRSVSVSSTLLSEGKDCLEKGDRVLLIGPGFLQLNIAKAAKAAGLIPMIIAPQKKIESFKEFVNDSEIMKEANIGLPDEKGTVSGVVFCSEEAVFGPELVKTVLDSKDTYADAEGPTRTIACVPASNTVTKEKSMGWIPIFNNDNKEQEIWDDFYKAFSNHPIAGSTRGTVIRFGNLLGGSIDGPSSLEKLGLDECIYKMTLENYRDLKERSFDRYRLGAQILLGDDINPRPENQDKLEKEKIEKGEDRESFRIIGGYPEVDRVNRNTAAQAVVQSLMRPSKGQFTVSDSESKAVPKEFTVLSKCTDDLPTEKEWDKLFQDPGPAEWPDPSNFDPSTLPTVEELSK